MIVLSIPLSAWADEWKLVWQDDFERTELGPDWEVLGNEAAIVDGQLHLVGVRASVLTSRGFPPDLKLEFDGGVLPGYVGCDLTPTLCCNEWWGNSPGYWLAFGAYYGDRNMLIYPGGKINLDDPQYRLESDTLYHMVALKDGAHVSLSANGHPLLDVNDPDPLGGPGFDRIAITTWSAIYVDNVRVYARERNSDEVPWLVKLPPLPLVVKAGTMMSAEGVDAAEALGAIGSFNEGDIRKAWDGFLDLPDSLVKAAGLAGCLGHLDYDKEPGQSGLLAGLFESLAAAAPENDREGLENHAIAARMRGEEPDGRISRVNAIRLVEIGAENNPYFLRAEYDTARALYWDAKEGGDRRTMEYSQRLFHEILSEWPDHPICRQYAGGKIPWGEDLGRYPEGTPAWAAGLHEAYARNVAIVAWWIRNRQKENGELGGGLGDDVELFRTWQPLAAISTGSPVLLEGIHRLCDGVWNHPAIRNGYWGGMLDVEHGAEYTGDTQPVMLFLDYGDPKYYERNMETARTIRDVFMAENDRGFRQFKSVDLGGGGIGDEPTHRADVPYDARAMKAVMWLAWAGNVEARELFLEWVKTWLDAAMSEEAGKPSGIVPAAVWYPGGGIVGSSGNWWEPRLGWDYYDWPFSIFKVYDAMNCAFYFDPDPRYLVPLRRTIDLAWSLPRLEDVECEKGTSEWVRQSLQNYGFLTNYSIATYRWLTGDTSYDENLRVTAKPYVRYLIDHDLEALAARFHEIAEGRRYNFELETREVLATDRANVGGVDDVFGAYTGAMRRWNDMGAPTCAATWVAEDTGFAALVESAGRERLTIRLYQFKDRPMKLGIRLWQLLPGKYERLSGRMEAVSSGLRCVEPDEREFVLAHRGQTEFITVPPRQEFLVDIRLIEAIEVPDNLPDPAIGREDVICEVAEDGTATVTVWVHNIGIAGTGPLTVSVKAGREEEPLARKSIPELQAPTDMLPSRTRIEFTGIPAGAGDELTIVVEPDAGREEWNPWNNDRTITLGAPANRTAD